MLAINFTTAHFASVLTNSFSKCKHAHDECIKLYIFYTMTDPATKNIHQHNNTAISHIHLAKNIFFCRPMIIKYYVLFFLSQTQEKTLLIIRRKQIKFIIPK